MNPLKLLTSLVGSNAIGGNLLGSLMGKVTGGGAAAKSASGGLGSMLGGLLGRGGDSSRGGMLGGLLGGGILGSLLGGGGAAEAPAQAGPAAEEEATLLIRAMCNAAKADGEVDDDERKNIIGRLGDEIDQDEIDFVRSELAAPLDVVDFAKSVPAGQAANVYMVSLMAIKVDTPQEAQYLKQLGQELNLDSQTISSIHRQLGVA